MICSYAEKMGYAGTRTGLEKTHYVVAMLHANLRRRLRMIITIYSMSCTNGLEMNYAKDKAKVKREPPYDY